MKPHIFICIVFLVMVVIGFGRLVLIDDSRVAHEPLYEEGSLVFSNGYLHGSSVNKGGKGVFPLVVEKSRIDSEKEESMTVERTAPNDIKYYFDDLSLRLRDFGDFYKKLDDLFVREDRESLWAEKWRRA